MFAAFSRSRDVFRYDLNGPNFPENPARVMEKVGIANNFGAISGTDDKVLLTTHRLPIRFFLNSRFREFCAPSRAWEYDIDQNRTREITLESGRNFPINSGSVAVEAGGRLWIGQVFEPGLLARAHQSIERP